MIKMRLPALVAWGRVVADLPACHPNHRVLRAYFDALTKLDPDGIAQLFAEHGEIEDPVGTSVRRGRPAVVEYWRSGLCAVAERIEIEILAALPAARSIAAHWRMTAYGRDGRVADAEGIDVLQVNDHGQISRAEGYWDQQAFRCALAG
ncbi:MAG TPA: nuclear transport factor 2 family protein [Solirubrobacteraceae bacterium]